MIGMEAASAELDRMIAAEAAAARPSEEQAATTDQSAPGGQDRAAQPEKTDAQPPDNNSADTRAAADSPKDQQQQNKPQDKNKPSKEASEAGKTLQQSRYAKARERQEKSWNELNRQKEELQKEREAFQKERDELTAQRQKQEQQYTPEQYEQAASVFEKQGRFDLAEAARERAKELRANPPKPDQALQQRQQQEAQQMEAAKKEWWGKAAVTYPDVVKQGTPQHQALRTFIESEPEVIRSPKGMFYAARLVSAETAAARVPEMEKELGALRARVKELEGLTAPAGEGAAQRIPGEKSFQEKSDSEQFAELEEQALAMGTLR